MTDILWPDDDAERRFQVVASVGLSIAGDDLTPEEAIQIWVKVLDWVLSGKVPEKPSKPKLKTVAQMKTV